MKALIPLLIPISTIFLTVPAYAQSETGSEPQSYTIYVDGGSVGYYSSAFLNAERRLSFNEEKGITYYGRLGGGYVITNNDREGWSGMGAIVSLIGNQPNFLEVTGGIAIGKDQNATMDASQWFTLPYFDIGYRYQSSKSGFLFRAKAGILGVGVGVGLAF